MFRRQNGNIRKQTTYIYEGIHTHVNIHVHVYVQTYLTLPAGLHYWKLRDLAFENEARYRMTCLRLSSALCLFGKKNMDAKTCQTASFHVAYF